MGPVRTFDPPPSCCGMRLQQLAERCGLLSRVALPLAQTALHVDPLFTAAWNTLVHGRKRWLLFPPDTTRATLFPRGDADEALPASVYLHLVYPGLRGVQGIDLTLPYLTLPYLTLAHLPRPERRAGH